MFLEKDILTYVPDATMAIAGGSLFANGGREKTSQSDYDIVVLAPHCLYAPSYNNIRSQYDDRKMDLIIRDPETLAHELEYARYSGSCSVPSIIATGQQVMGDPAKGAVLQRKMQDFLKQGPDPMDRVRYARDHSEISNTLDHMALMNEDEKHLATLEAVHNIAHLYVRTNRHWVSKGKILGRYLLDFPEFKKDLEDSYRQNTPSVMMRFVDADAQILSDFSDPYLGDAGLEENENIRDRFMVAYSAAYATRMMRHGDEDQKRIVREFLGNKITSVAGAVNPERIGRASNEYFYALTRLVLTMASTMEITKGVEKKECYAALIHEFPDIAWHIDAAETGNPTRLKGLAMEIADDLNPNSDGFGIRVVPDHFRRDGSAFKPLIG